MSIGPNSERLKQQGQNFAAKHPDAAGRIQNNASERVQRRNEPRRQTARERAPEHLAIDRAGRQAGNMRELGHDFGRRDVGQFNGGGQFRGGGGFGGHEFSGARGGAFHGGGGAGFRRR